MTASRGWADRYAFWQSVPRGSYALFLGGVFLMFLPVGLLVDVSRRGAESASHLVANMLFSGSLAIAYLVVFSRRPRWLPVLIVVHILLTLQLNRLSGARMLPLTGAALEARLVADTRGIVVCIVASFVCLSNFVQRQGSRYVRVRTEIALASDIHRRLVPPIAQRLDQFEFRGVSRPSSDVGGDLIDLVESSGRWIAYVADVSGHGVAAGLLMGMVKSAARTELRTPTPVDRMLNDLNAVLIDLKSPQMFVTFAGLQFDGGSQLLFSVAGHLPILHYRRATSTLEELSTPQVPLALFGDRSFTASRVAFAPGDLFVILTDGLTEVFDDQDREFGFDRVKALIGENAMEPLERLEHKLLAEVRGHGAQLDDQTLLLVRAVG